MHKLFSLNDIHLNQVMDMKTNQLNKSCHIFNLTMALLMFGVILTSCGGKTKTTTDQSKGSVDVCKCLTESGDSPYMIANKDACRDAISKELGVDNWEKVNMSQNLEVSRKFDELAERCTQSGLGTKQSARTSQVEKHNCLGDQNCISEVRRLVNGAGYEIANEHYEGDGIFYITAFKYGPGEPIDITYVMDCNCEPVDIKIGNAVRTNSSSEKLHRCGRSWNGSLYEGGVYGDYCGLECYADNYPN